MMHAPVSPPESTRSVRSGQHWPRSVALAVAVLALAAAGYFRLWRLGSDPLWLDEAYSAFAAAHGWRFLWQVVPTYETHPPVYYSLLHLWRGMAGDGVPALRTLGALFAFATLAAAWGAADALGRLLAIGRVERSWLATTMLLLVALDPLLIEMARQVRPYPVMACVYGAALIPLLRIARAGRDGALPRGSLALFCAAEAAMLWLHSLGPLFAGAMGLALLCVLPWRALGRADWMWLVGAHLVVGIVWLPGVLILLDQAPTWVASTWLEWKPELLWINLGSIYGTWNRDARLIAAALIAAGLAMLLIDRRWRGAGLALAILALLPTAAALLLTVTVSPVFIVRTVSPVTVPALLLIARAATPPPRPHLRWLLSLPTLALLLSMALIDMQMTRWPPPQDWYGTVRWLRPRVHQGDEVWAYPNEGALPFRYAVRDLAWTMKVRSVPVEIPATHARGFHPTGSRGVVSLYPDDIARLAASPAARAPDTIWLLRLGPWAYDKGDLMLKALSADRVTIGHWRRGAIDLVGLQRRMPDR